MTNYYPIRLIIFQYKDPVIKQRPHHDHTTFPEQKKPNIGSSKSPREVSCMRTLPPFGVVAAGADPTSSTTSGGMDESPGKLGEEFGAKLPQGGWVF